MKKLTEIADDKKSHRKSRQKYNKLKIECGGDADAKNFVAYSNCIPGTCVFNKDPRIVEDKQQMEVDTKTKLNQKFSKVNSKVNSEISDGEVK